MVVSSNAADPPHLGENGRYKYSRHDSGEYAYALKRLEKETLSVSVALRGDQVIAYGIADPSGTAAEIKFDSDESYRRHTGLQRTVIPGGRLSAWVSVT